MAQVAIALTVLMGTAHYLFFPPAVQSGVAANVSNTIYVPSPSRPVPAALLQSLQSLLIKHLKFLSQILCGEIKPTHHCTKHPVQYIYQLSLVVTPLFRAHSVQSNLDNGIFDKRIIR